MPDVYNQGKLLTEAVCANVQNPHCFTAANAAAYIVVIPYIEFLQMVNHPLTDIGIMPFSQGLESIFQ
jgi:transaldolase